MEKRSGSTLTVLDLLLVAFIVLKLTHVIDWSWVWVLSPIWITFAIVIIIATVMTIKKRP